MVVLCYTHGDHNKLSGGCVLRTSQWCKSEFEQIGKYCVAVVQSIQYERRGESSFASGSAVESAWDVVTSVMVKADTGDCGYWRSIECLQVRSQNVTPKSCTISIDDDVTVPEIFSGRSLAATFWGWLTLQRVTWIILNIYEYRFIAMINSEFDGFSCKRLDAHPVSKSSNKSLYAIVSGCTLEILPLLPLNMF